MNPPAARSRWSVHRRMADCHPRRHLFRERLCRECFQLRSEPLRLGQALPPRVRDVEQRTVLSVPERCPECDGLVYGQAPTAADPALARRMACAICGWDAYLTSDVVVTGEPARVVYLGERPRSQETKRLDSSRAVRPVPPRWR